MAASGGSGSIAVTASGADCAWSATRDATWITITAGASGKGNGTVAYSVDANAAATERRGTLTVSGQTHTVTQAGKPAVAAPAVTAVVNAGDRSAALAPGGVMSIVGSNLAATAEGAYTEPLPASLAGTSVEVSSGGATLAAPLFSVSAQEILAQMPFEVAEGGASVRVKTAGGASNVLTISLTARAPRLLTTGDSGNGTVAAVRPDGSDVSGDNPAQPGEVVTIFGTGLGVTDPPGRTGYSGTGKETVAGVTATVGNSPAEVTGVTLSGAAPGIYEIGVKIPQTVVAGPDKIAIKIAGAACQNGATLPAGEKEILLSERSNTLACNVTNRSPFKLEKEAFVTRLSVWYRWDDNEPSVDFTLKHNGVPAYAGTLVRGGATRTRNPGAAAKRR